MVVVVVGFCFCLFSHSGKPKLLTSLIRANGAHKKIKKINKQITTTIE